MALLQTETEKGLSLYYLLNHLLQLRMSYSSEVTDCRIISRSRTSIELHHIVITRNQLLTGGPQKVSDQKVRKETKNSSSYD